MGRAGVVVGGIKVGVRTKGWENGERDGGGSATSGEDETEEE